MKKKSVDLSHSPEDMMVYQVGRAIHSAVTHSEFKALKPHLQKAVAGHEIEKIIKITRRLLEAS